jgi:hypothetical protein
MRSFPNMGVEWARRGSRYGPWVDGGADCPWVGQSCFGLMERLRAGARSEDLGLILQAEAQNSTRGRGAHSHKCRKGLRHGGRSIFQCWEGGRGEVARLHAAAAVARSSERR